MSAMRVALVSPYSWTYPGGVTRHIEALAGELLAAGHDVRVLAPFDPDDRRTAWAHRGARPQARPVPEWLVPLGGTLGWASNGAVSNLAGTPVRDRPAAARAARRALRRRARARAGRPRRGVGRADVRRRPARRHLPLLLGARAAAHGGHADGRPPQAQPPGRAHRGLRRRRLDRPPLLRRRLPDHPQRRRDPGRRRARAARAGRGRAAARSPSSARPSSARACPCCCAPSRRCAPRSPPSS